MSGSKFRAWRWLAPVALVGSVGLAACGDEDATVSTSAADVGASDVAGSDRHLENQAADIAERSITVSGSDVHLENQAAEIAEEMRQDQAALTDGDDGDDDEFVPGSRRMPMR
jgi:hypothetical protein